MLNEPLEPGPVLRICPLCLTKETTATSISIPHVTRYVRGSFALDFGSVLFNFSGEGEE